MLNKFFVSGYRFHVYNKRILLIKGEFRNNDKGNEKLFVTLDDKKNMNCLFRLRKMTIC